MRVLHRQERVPQVVERVVYEEVSASREKERENECVRERARARENKRA